ncbi:alpha/beta-hydrolase [Pluteus cervinus]|uniref:Alpha/beta-hydrolase n=1 Tax=Pluteus cervinus TaxID=181527 RepID=A0ACD3BAF5_9AGAR|nr:alpha/beta-hydrolase [Pluteus cervinus]
MASTTPEASQPEAHSLFKESWPVGPSNTKLYTRVYTPPSSTPTRAVIVFIHGFAEHVARYTHFHARLPEHGIAVFTFDQRGFGRSGLDTENRSPGSAYGKSSWKDQAGDIQWAIDEAKKEFPDVPIFLMGHSMGGGEVLGFATQHAEAASTNLAGIIATSPLIHQTKPAPKLLRWVGGKASILAPYTLVPATVVPSELAHDPAVGEAYLKDPLVKQSGSLRGIADMLNLGEALYTTSYKQWPESLPVLIIHGTADQVTSCEASKAFHDKIPAKHKSHKEYADGYHELQNESQEVQNQLKADIVEFVNTYSQPKSKL